MSLNLIINLLKKYIVKINKIDNFIHIYEKDSKTICLPSRAFLNWGISLSKLSKYDDAIKKFEISSSIKDKNPETYLHLGILQLKKNNIIEAINNFKKVIELDKKNTKAYILWGCALTELKNYNLAYELYKQAKKLDENDPDLYFKWGITLIKDNKKGYAINYLKRALMYDIENVEVNFLLGILYMEEKQDYNLARDYFIRTLELDSQYTEARHYLAYCYYKLKNYKLSIFNCLKAIKKADVNIQTHIILAENYLKLNRKEKALKTYEEYTGEKTAEFYASWGITLEKLNNLEGAKEKFDTSLLLNKDNTDILYKASRLYLKLKLYDESFNLAYKTLKTDPDNIKAVKILGDLNFQIKRYEKAINYYEKVLNRDKKNPILYFYIAKCYENIEKTDQAIYYYEKVIEYIPKFKLAYINLVKLLIKEENFKKANRKMQTAYKLFKRNYLICYYFGKTFQLLKLYNNALVKYNECNILNPEYSKCIIDKINLLIDIKEYENALNYLIEKKDTLIKNKENNNIYNSLEIKLRNLLNK